MRRAAGKLLLVLGWAVIVLGTIFLGSLVPAPFYWDEVAKDSFLFILVGAIVSALAGITLLRWAWSLLGTPGGSNKQRMAFAWGLLFISGLTLVGAVGSDYESEAEQASLTVAAVAPSLLAVILLLIPIRRGPAERSVTAPTAPTMPITQGMELPPPPGSPSPSPSATATEPEHARRREPWIIAGVAAAVVMVVIAIVAIVVVQSEDSLPDKVAGLDRLDTDDARALEDMIDQFKFGDVRVEVAVYGAGSIEQLILVRYSNLASALSVSSLLRAAGGGMVGSGGTADLDAQTVETRAGVEYQCIPFVGRLFATDLFRVRGQLCAWTEGDDEAVLLMDVVAQDAGSAVTHAAAAHEALS